MYSVLNTFSEHRYFYIPKNITSYIESLLCIIKLVEVSPVFKNKGELDKEYSVFIVLSHMQKAFERNMHYQISDFMTDKLSKQ